MKYWYSDNGADRPDITLNINDSNFEFTNGHIHSTLLKKI